MERGNLFDGIPAELPAELETLLLEGSGFRLKRIISRGHHSDWYDQGEDEWVLLVKGAAELEFDGRPQRLALAAGDHLLIPAHCRHRVSWTDPEEDTLWLALYGVADAT
jgi:cupin 2 domain-containing protein